VQSSRVKSVFVQESGKSYDCAVGSTLVDESNKRGKELKVHPFAFVFNGVDLGAFEVTGPLQPAYLRTLLGCNRYDLDS
jgi:hypothetical protein